MWQWREQKLCSEPRQWSRWWWWPLDCQFYTSPLENNNKSTTILTDMQRRSCLRGYQTIDKVGRFFLPITSSETRTRSIFDDKIGQLFGYRSPWWLFALGDEYLFWLFILFVTLRCLFSLTRCRKSNASIILRSAFCCCVSVKLADIVRICKRQNRPCVMVQQFYRPIFSGK